MFKDYCEYVLLSLLLLFNPDMLAEPGRKEKGGGNTDKVYDTAGEVSEQEVRENT